MTEEVVTPPPLPRRRAAGTVVALVMIVAGIIAAFVINQRRHVVAEGAKAIIEAGNRRAKDLPVIGTVGAFTLTERSGAPVTLDALLGRVWVAAYFFTYCGGPCPTMNFVFPSVRPSILSPAAIRPSMDPPWETSMNG